MLSLLSNIFQLSLKVSKLGQIRLLTTLICSLLTKFSPPRHKMQDLLISFDFAFSPGI